MKRLRQQIHLQMDPKAWPTTGLSPVNKVLTAIVVLSVAIVIIETERSVSEPFADHFAQINMGLAVVFTIEYVNRIWAMGKRPEYAGILGRLRYATRFTAIVDLLAIAPFFLGFLGSNAFVIRLLRLARIFALAKLGRITAALNRLRHAFYSRRHELIVSVIVALMIMLFAATGMYIVEGSHQPEAFGSIPRAMWWAMSTLTTVGYGDVYPNTAPGKIFAGLIALASLGLIAMPTGILAAAFGEAFKHLRRDSEEPAIEHGT